MLYLYALLNVPLDIDLAVFFHPHGFKFFTVFKRLAVYLFQRAGKRNLLKSTRTKAPFSDVLYAPRDLNLFEVQAPIKCGPLDSLQRGRKLDVLYRALVEGTGT